MEYSQPLMRYTHTNNSLLSSGNTKKSTTYEPRTEAISPAINDDILNAEDSTSKSTKDEQTLIVEKLRKVEAEILQTDLQIVRLRRQKEQLEQAANSANKDDDDQENICDTKQLSIAKLVYHENRAKAQRAHSKLDCLGGLIRDLPIYNQPTDNAVYHHNSIKFNSSFKKLLVGCFKSRLTNRVKLEESISAEYDRRMEKWLKSIEIEDSQPSKRIKDAKAREFFEKQFPELKKARESGERFSRVGQRVARSDAEVAELMDGITEREDQDKKVKSYAVIPPMLEEMRTRKPKFINTNGYVDDIIAEYKEYQILNTWTDEEKDIFRENYLQHPKDFGLISRMTTRKNVANCVQYYYLSKKSENYKQLLKRQQKRRTRSFVKPAQATPANTSINESNNDRSASGNDKQTCDSNMTEVNNASETTDDSLQSALSAKSAKDGLNNINHGGGGGDQPRPRCCICDCEFSETNQSRNVTRSNHQIYGIALELLKPGLMICYSCRFRHVKHPSFDNPSNSPEPMDAIVDEACAGDTMDVDTQLPGIEPKHNPNCNLPPSSQQLNLPQIAASPIRASPPIDQPCADNGDAHKSTKRTCVRDIIYQAIEMSFQKQETPNETQPKMEPIRPERAPPTASPILPPPPISTIAGPVYGLPHQAAYYRPVQPILPVQRHRFIDDGSQIKQQQQYHMQNLQVQQQQQQNQLHHPQHIRQPYPPPIIHRPVTTSMPLPQQPIINRLPNQPFQTISPNTHMAPAVRHQAAPKPPDRPVELAAHPLNLCLKSSDPIKAPLTTTSSSNDDGAVNRSPANCEQSRSPNLTGSPTSPSEMVIDESADVSSPIASEQDDDAETKRSNGK